MTSIERMYGLYRAIRYVVDENIPGDVVECGVWMGGSAMVGAMTLELVGNKTRDLYLYDTFEGMTPPTTHDINHDGVHANKSFNLKDRIDGESNVWAYASLENVRRNLDHTGVSRDRFHSIKGKVGDTIPSRTPNVISLLRFDTDW